MTTTIRYVRVSADEQDLEKKRHLLVEYSISPENLVSQNNFYCQVT